MAASLVDRLNSQIRIDYIPEISDHHHDLLDTSLIDVAALDSQHYYTWNIRNKIIDKLISINYSLRLSQLTLFNSIQLLDQYTSKQTIDDFVEAVCISITCLWISSKLHDDKSGVITLKEMSDFLQMCKCSPFNNNLELNSQHFCQLEMKVLETLNWNLHIPTIHEIIETSLLNVEDVIVNKELFKLSIFFAELTFHERSFLYFDNELKAITCILMAANVLQDSTYASMAKSDLLKLEIKKIMREQTFEFNFPCLKHCVGNVDLTNIRKIALLIFNNSINIEKKLIFNKYNKSKTFQKFLRSMYNFTAYFETKTNILSTITNDISIIKKESLNPLKVNLMDFLPTFQNRSASFLVTSYILNLPKDGASTDEYLLSQLMNNNSVSIGSPMLSPPPFIATNNRDFYTPKNYFDSTSSLPSLITSPCESSFSRSSSNSFSSSSSSSSFLEEDINTPPSSAISQTFNEASLVNGLKKNLSFPMKTIHYDSPNNIKPKILDYNKTFGTTESNIEMIRKRNFEDIEVNPNKRHSPSLRN